MQRITMVTSTPAPEDFDGYTIEYLRVGLLTTPVDHGLVPYQRNRGQNGKPGAGLKVRFRKYGPFDARLVRFREVNRRKDGTLACMDGNGSNHWIEGQKGFDYLVPCKVYENLTLAEEAGLFLGFQRTKQVTKAEQFNAGEVAGDEIYTTAARIAGEAGFTIGTGRKPGVIGWSAIEYALRNGETRLKDTLATINANFPDDTSANNAGFIMALSDVLGNVDLDASVLEDVLKTARVDDLRENRTGGAAKSTIFNNIIRLYNDLYNDLAN